MTTYLVDYENTSHHGLDGFKKLNPGDTVVIFLGAKNASSSIPIDVVRELTGVGDRALLLWKRSKKTSKNYLDLQLVSYLGSLIGDTSIAETDYVIVSNDHDFEAAIDFWGDRRADITIALRSTIALMKQQPKPEPTATVPSAVGTSEATKRAVRKAVKDLGLKPAEYSAIYRAFAASGTSQELHTALGRSLGAQGPRIYPLVKAIHADLSIPR